MKYGIIGNGVVGNATANIFEYVKKGDNLEVRRWDKDPSRATHFIAEVLACDYVFICIPTPASGRGPLDITALYQVAGMMREFKPTCAVIRSTVNVGNTREFSEVSHWPTLFWPEFLSERSAVEDALKPPLTLLGTTGNDIAHATRFASQLTAIFGKTVHPDGLEEIEFTKLASNACGAVQVALANELVDLCIEADVEWPTVRQHLLGLGRIIPTYSKVPGPDGQRGFGGKCFPKDIAATANLGNIREATLLRATIERNKLDRRD